MSIRRKVHSTRWFVFVLLGMLGAISVVEAGRTRGNAPEQPHTWSSNRVVTQGPATDEWTLPVSKTDLEQFIAKFTQAYVQGATEEFAGLFAARVRTQDGEVDRRDLRADYAELFLSTLGRRFEVQDLQWSALADGILGEGDFQIFMSTRRDGKALQGSGALRLVLIRSADQLRIREMYLAYDVDPNAPDRNATKSK